MNHMVQSEYTSALLSQCSCGTDKGIGSVGGLALLTLVIGTWFLIRWAWSAWKLQGISLMNRNGRIAIIVLLAIGIGGILVAKGGNSPTVADTNTQAPPVAAVLNLPATKPATSKLPRLLDLGATQCIPCKMMAPILEELKTQYAGKLQVDFVDVWKDRATGDQYKIESIPTQIFFDASGKELFRHQGFYAREDILAKWKELGFTFNQ